MTRSIHKRERQLGVVLFKRFSVGIKLTSMGEVFHRGGVSLARLAELPQWVDSVR
jgi:DNA-binding transcriptional LysR family regulator